MTTNTDQVRALIAKWQAAPYGKGDHDYYVDGLRACARELEAALAQQAGAEPVAYVDLANWHGGLRADECFFTDWQDDDTVPLYLSQQTAAPSGEVVAGVEPLLEALIHAAFDDGDNEREEFSERVKAARDSVVAYVQRLAAAQQQGGVE